MPELEPHYLEGINIIIQRIAHFLVQNHAIPVELQPQNLTVLRGLNERNRFTDAFPDLLQGEFNPNRPMETSIFKLLPDDTVTSQEIIYLPDQSVINAVDGTSEDQDALVEELSHAYFSHTHLHRHGVPPHSAMLELIGQLDVCNYRLFHDPTIRLDLSAPPQAQEESLRKWNSFVQRALAGYYTENYLGTSSEPHYYFAHKWAGFLINVLNFFWRINPQLTSVIFQEFYEASDEDQLHMLLVGIRKVCHDHGMDMGGVMAYDPTNQLEKALFERIAREIGNPRIIVDES